MLPDWSGWEFLHEQYRVLKDHFPEIPHQVQKTHCCSGLKKLRDSVQLGRPFVDLWEHLAFQAGRGLQSAARQEEGASLSRETSKDPY